MDQFILEDVRRLKTLNQGAEKEPPAGVSKRLGEEMGDRFLAGV